MTPDEAVALPGGIPPLRIWGWREIAEAAGVSLSTLRRWKRREPGFRRILHPIRSRVFVYETDLRAWAEGRTEEDRPNPPSSIPESCPGESERGR